MFGKKKTEQEKDKKEEQVELTDTKPSADQASVGEMKRGDYRIHVYVEKAKDLKVPEDSTIDPLIEISCLNLKQYTTVKEKIGGIGETVWNEHLFLEPMNVQKQSADEAKISMKILDKGLLKNTQVGQFEFDMSFIYFKKDHALLHQWVAISDPNSENYSEITGYLKISINVCCQGDEPIQINDDDGADDSNIMMPPSLNPKFHQIKIRFFQAQDIAMMDIGIALLGKKSKTDAYFTTTYKKKQLKTQIKVFEEGKKFIDINEEIWVPAQVPIIQKKLIVKLMDYDVDGDEVVGSLQFDMKDIIEGAKNNAFMWKNIYGSPISTSIMSGQNKTQKKLMDENPELASSWKGRILMQIECYQTEKPEAKTQKIDQEIIDDSVQYTSNRKYEIIAEIGQGVALPDNKKYQVKLIVGGKELITESAAYQKSNYNRFNKRFEQQSLLLPYLNVEDFGSIILVLMDEDKPICYYKDSINNYKKEDAEYKWIQLLPDRCINIVKDDNKAGLISFKLSISASKNIDFKQFKAWKKLPSKRANPVLIRAYIYQCRDLPAADDDGGSDPFVKLWDLSGKEKRTRVIYDNVNPLFFQVVELEYEIRDEMDDLYSYPPFIIDVFDHDDEIFDSTPDYLGRAIIEPEDCSISLQSQFEKNKKMEIPQKPRWHPLKFAEGEPACGQILISFSVSSLEYNYQYSVNNVDLRSRVEFQEFDVSMLVLGLRQLQSPGILPVKKAYINFNVKSLVPAENTAIQNIQTQPQALGPNPTINTTIEFSIPLPTEQLYCPRMSCMVYDNIYLGFSQPQIGIFTIPIGDIMFDLKKERKEELQAIEFIVNELDKIIEAGPELNVKNYSKNKNEIESSSSTMVKNKRKKSANKYQQSINMTEKSDYEVTADNDEMEMGLLNKDDFDSSISISLKAKKKTSGRKKSGQSSVSDIDEIQKQKKKYGKKVKGSEIEIDVKEQLGANQRDGEQFADDSIQEQLQGIQKRKESIQQTGMFPNQIEESKENFQRRNSLARFSIRKGSVNQRDQLSKYDKLKQLEDDKFQEKRIMEDKRKQAEEERLASGQDSTQIILLPEYELDKRLKVYREVNYPSADMYEGLGWDENRDEPTIHQKHYRLYYNDELENIKEIFPKQSPFNSYDITKGQERGISKSIFSVFQKIKKDSSGQDSTKKKVGTFKGIVEVESKEDKDSYRQSKTVLLDRLKQQISIISEQKTGRDYRELDIDADKLFSPIERKKTELKFREFGIDHLCITKHLADLESEIILKRMLMKKTKCLVRFYAINADHLSSRDIGSDSDPYLYLTCNDKIYNERNNYQLDNPNPKFYKHYDFEGVFPGCSPLKIDIFDYDDIFGDDLIGTTSIDLEDRYFSLEWQNLNDKPIEVRQIYIQSSAIDQGTIKCWVEINDIETPKEEQLKIWDISEKPAEEFEIRICVFNCKDVKMMDFEGTSDVFCRGFFDSKEDVQETDTHYRNQDGKPDFQYRLVYKLQYPRKNNDYKFTIQMYDRDFFKSNDMIGSAQIDLKNLIEDSSLTKQPLCLNETYYQDVLGSKFPSKLIFDSKDKSRFWLDMKSKNKEKNKLEVNGQVKLQIDVLPFNIAEKNKVGKARDQPNHSPQLPQPEGRLELSINPFKMFNQMVGPALRKKIYCGLCIILACILFLAILPNIAGSIFSQMVCKIIHVC